MAGKGIRKRERVRASDKMEGTKWQTDRRSLPLKDIKGRREKEGQDNRRKMRRMGLVV